MDKYSLILIQSPNKAKWLGGFNDGAAANQAFDQAQPTVQPGETLVLTEYALHKRIRQYPP